MKSLSKPHFERVCMLRQRGLVLFFALIALVALSLAAVALIRSVDTSTMIAGNLAFKQAATTSGDAGVEAAMRWLALTEASEAVRLGANQNVLNNTTHLFNNTDATRGYYSNVNSVNLTANANAWNAITNIAETTDGSGNKIRYIIERMCNTADRLPATLELPLLVPPKTECLFSSATVDRGGQSTPLYQDICDGLGCPVVGQAPQIRITARTIGPKNTVSYVQAFVY